MYIKHQISKKSAKEIFLSKKKKNIYILFIFSLRGKVWNIYIVTCVHVLFILAYKSIDRCKNKFYDIVFLQVYFKSLHF